MNIRTYYKKREAVKAIQWTGTNLHDLSRFLGDCLGPIERRMDYKPKIKGKNDATYFWIELGKGDWVYQSEDGIFHATRDKYFWQQFETGSNKEAVKCDFI